MEDLREYDRSMFYEYRHENLGNIEYWFDIEIMEDMISSEIFGFDTITELLKTRYVLEEEITK